MLQTNAKDKSLKRYVCRCLLKYLEYLCWRTFKASLLVGDESTRYFVLTQKMYTHVCTYVSIQFFLLNIRTYVRMYCHAKSCSPKSCLAWALIKYKPYSVGGLGLGLGQGLVLLTWSGRTTCRGGPFTAL